MATKRFTVALMAVGLALAGAAALAGTSARLTGAGAVGAVAALADVAIDADDIGGVVSGAKGPEAGVWVIAETTSLPTKFSRIVVTDDRGRYLIPDLPKATYDVWVRGYGLVDSPRVKAAPGQALNLKAVTASSAAAAAQYYPANYWYSLMKVPDKSEFPGTGQNGNGIAETVKSQAQWIRMINTDGCVTCHQLGDKATREIPETLGRFQTTFAAWDARVQAGQAGGIMSNTLNQIGRKRALEMFADWTDRVRAGELPPVPPRPQGLERNVVVTQWDWADPHAYLHDEISTDKRHPTTNPNGLIYGSLEASADYMPTLDPVRHTAGRVPVPVGPDTPYAAPRAPVKPSPYWKDEAIWDSKANVHNVMFDRVGRVWLTSAVRSNANPAFCKAGSEHPSAKAFPVANAGRHLSVYDPKTKEFSLISTCFSTHHLVFAEDANDTLWTSGGGQVVGWLNTKMYLATHDAEKSQGWTALVLDTNGNGKRDDYVEPDQPIDPAKDKRINAGFYGVTVNPADGSIWGTALGFPGAIVRLNPGSNPPATALAEIYELPWNNAKAAAQGFSPRGLDITRDGVVWTVLSSGHLASFDRRKCKGPLNGPNATGQQCPEGWTLDAFPGPKYKGAADNVGSAEASYYDWVDQFDTFGLGHNVPIVNGSNSDSVMALVNGKFLVFRVPYPNGFFSKWMDGRIDDPNAGWKGKGLWATYGTRTPFHTETGKGTPSKVVHFQLRPDPLAK